MPTYFKYAKREADSYVNWAQLGMDMSKMIADENKAREDKKEELNQATRTALNDLANAPMGENQDINQVTADAANDATEYIKMQEKLFKSGRLKYNDYIHNRQNITDGYKNLFGASKTMQADWTATQERVRKGEASKTDIDVKATLEGLGNIANTKIYINPTNGMVSVAKTKKEIINGKEVITMDSDPNKMFTVNELLNYSKQKFDKFKTEEVDSQIKAIGKKTDSIIHQGTLDKIGDITSITDPNIMSRFNTDAEKAEVTNFKKFVTETANIYAGDEYKAQSILRDYVDVNPKTLKPYQIRFTNKYDAEEAKKNPDIIYLQKESSGRLVPVLSDEQKKVARDFVEARIYAGIDQEKKIQATAYKPYPPQQSEAGMIRDINKRDAKNLAENLATAMTGTDEQAQNSLGYLRGQGVFAEKEGNILTAYDKSGRKITFDLKKERNPQDIIRRIIGAVNPRPGEISEDDVVTFGMNFIGTKPIIASKKKVGYGWEGVATTDGLSDAVTNLSSDIFQYKGPKLADELNKQLKKFDVTAKDAGTYFNEKIELSVKDKDGNIVTKEFPANAFTENGALQTKSEISSWIEGVRNPAP